MGLFDMFAKPAAQPAADPNKATPGNMPADPSTTVAQKTPGNGTVPASAENMTTDVKSPMDKFSEILQTKPNAQSIESVTFSGKPEDVMAAARQVDFTKVVTPDQLKAIGEGGEKAAQVFVEAMNSVAQNTFAQASMTTAKVVETALAKQQENFTKALPEIIRRANISTTVRESNPMFNHPAVAPIVTMLEGSLSAKYPDASGKQITEMAQEYFSNLASQFAAATPAEQAAAAKKGNAEIDWSKFLS